MKILSDIKEEMVTDDKWSRSFFLPVCLSVAEPRLHIRSGEGRPNIGEAATSHFSFCKFSARQNNTKILVQQYITAWQKLWFALHVCKDGCHQVEQGRLGENG